MVFAEQIPIILVLGAGFVTLLSPCGYALIPGYIAYLLGGNITFRRVMRGIVFTLIGIFTVFSLVGLALAISSQIIQSILPHLTLAAALIILLIGISKTLEINIPIFGFSHLAGKSFKSSSFFSYGIAYAFAGAGCTLPIFFAVLLYASLTPGLEAFITMLTYSTGVAIPLVITGILTGTANIRGIQKIGRLTAKINRLSGIILIGAGIYLIYYYLSFYQQLIPYILP